MAMKAAQDVTPKRRYRMKRAFREFCIIFCTAAVIFLLVINLLAYLEKRDCLCSKLTKDVRTLPIDDRLSRVYDLDFLNSGTFILLTTNCAHGIRMQITIYPDEGVYRGSIIGSE